MKKRPNAQQDAFIATTMAFQMMKAVYMLENIWEGKMPLTTKGKKIKRAMMETYGSKEKGDRVFYASQNKGTIKGTHKKSK